MLSITKNDVPEYLRSGLFYCSLEGDDAEVFEVPANVTKPDLILHGKEDLQHLLSSLRYWMVMEPPIELVEFCLLPGSEELPCLDDDQHLSYLPVLRRVQQKQDPKTQLDEAIVSGYFPILRCVVDLIVGKGLVKLSSEHFGLALRTNSVECVRYFVEQGCPHNVNTRHYYQNSVDCLEYVLTHCPNYKPHFNSCLRGTEDTAVVDCLLAHGYSWDCDTMRAFPWLSFVAYMSGAAMNGKE